MFNELEQEQQKQQEETTRRGFMGQIVAEALLEIEKLLKQGVAELTKTIKSLMSHNYSVKVLNPVTKVQAEITNFPNLPEPKETISLKEAKELKESLDRIEKAVREGKITIPEVKIPQVPDKITVLNPVKEVAVTNLDRIAKYLDTKSIVKAIKESNKEIKVNPILPRFEVKQDNTELLKAILELKAALNINFPEADYSGIVEASKETTKAIKDLEFPIPTFASSWQHSLDMQSKDLAKTIAYVGATENIDYIQFVGVDGNTYRKTFNYDEAGRNTGWTAWVKQ